MSSTPNSSSGNVIVVGSVNQDLVFTTNCLPLSGETVLANQLKYFAGGKGANQAVAAARQGAKVTFVGAVGDDLFGTQLRAQLMAEAIDLKNLRTIPNCTTGTASIVVDQAGHNHIVVSLGANAQVTVDQVANALADACEGDILLMPLELPIAVVSTALRIAKSAGLTTVLNPSPVEPLLKCLTLLLDVDLLIVNQRETEQLCGFKIEVDDIKTLDKAYRRLLEHGCKDVVLTLGAQGVFYRSQVFPAPIVKVVDTTGAGDCFAGSLVAALVGNTANSLTDADRSSMMKQAIGQAQFAASISVGFEGAQTGMPRRNER
jgi:ribokinase